MKRSIWIIGFAVLLHALPSLGQTVVRDGKEWLQPFDFRNLSWDDVNAVCPAGVCAGTLNGIDVTGYTWASTADAISLLNNGYGVTPPVIAVTNSSSAQDDSAWAPAFVSEFTPLSAITGGERVMAINSDIPSPDFRHVLIVTDVFAPGGSDVAVPAGAQGYPALPVPIIGALFWRTPVPPTATPFDAEAVPTLSAYGLALTILGLFVIATRRLSRRKAKVG